MNDQPDRWRVVAGAVLGLLVGNGPIMQFTFGVLVMPVAMALHADRETMSLALMAGLIATGLATPFVGRAIDKLGIRAVCVPMIALFAAAMAGIGLLVNTPGALIGLYALAGIAAAGQTPLPYSKAIAAAFNRQRGMALGIAMAGVGLGAALMPALAHQLVIAVGWRGTYLGLAALTAVVALPSMAFLVTRRGAGAGAAVGSLKRPGAVAGATRSEAIRSLVFWKLGIAFFFVAMAAAGVIAHIVPLLSDRGVSANSATAVLSFSGAALIVGRLIAGWMLDRVHAPFVALTFFALPLAGIVLLLTTQGSGIALAATVCVGLGLGAEVDLIAFLLSRYLGLRSFGELYGYLFAVFMLGSGLGPFAMGSSAHRLHSYDPALIGLAAGLAFACWLMTRLGAYVYPGAEAGGLDSTDPALADSERELRQARA